MAQAEGAAKIDIVTAIADDGWPRAPYAWYVLFLLILVYAVATLDRVVIGLLVDAMKRDLGLSDTSISLLIGLAFSLFYTIASLPVGILIDRYRRVPILTASLVLFASLPVGILIDRYRRVPILTASLVLFSVATAPSVSRQASLRCSSRACSSGPAKPR